VNKTTDTTDELLEEWVWETALPLGRPVERKKAHRDGIPHEGVHLWIVRNGADGPELLFQHRAPKKDMYPDVLDITVGGHVTFGLTENKIQKESYEEIGIAPSDGELIDLGYFRYEEITDAMFHREFQRVYLMADNRKLEEYVFMDGEVAGLYAVPVDYLKGLFAGDSVRAVEGYDGREPVVRKVSRKDFHPLLFAPSMKDYMATLFRACDEWAAGGRVSALMPHP